MWSSILSRIWTDQAETQVSVVSAFLPCSLADKLQACHQRKSNASRKGTVQLGPHGLPGQDDLPVDKIIVAPSDRDQKGLEDPPLGAIIKTLPRWDRGCRTI
jgi:hypothetical protein